MQWTTENVKKIESLLNTKSAQKIAVFDADGTLWHDDLGETFFKYQIREKLAPNLLDFEDPWNHYRNLDTLDPVISNMWLVQFNAGTPEKLLREQAAKNYKDNFKNKIPDPIKWLLEELRKAQFEIWICSASLKWALEPALEDLGIPIGRLIAASVKVDSKGILTDEFLEPMPYGNGKKTHLLRKIKSPPLLVAGNSMGDTEIIKLAKELPLVIGYHPPRGDVKHSEERLQALAVENQWAIQIFR